MKLDLWILSFDDCRDTALQVAYRQLLSPQELIQLDRFIFEHDRHRYLASRALVRTVLSRLLSVSARELVFGTGPYGKPHLDRLHPLMRRLSFNLSHTTDMAILGVTTDRALGVDVEKTDREAPIDAGNRYFSAVEAHSLNELITLDARAKRFWSFWTLKESLIKATGRGLSTPLDRFGFIMEGNDGVSLQCADGTEEGANRWWFGQWQPSNTHLAAVCVERSRGSDRETPMVRIVEVVPLRTERNITPHFIRVSADTL